jgi:hypothetical protein
MTTKFETTIQNLMSSIENQKTIEGIKWCYASKDDITLAISCIQYVRMFAKKDAAILLAMHDLCTDE